MAEIIPRTGTTDKIAKDKGKYGEIAVDIDKKTVVVYDGQTVGGYIVNRNVLNGNLVINGNFSVNQRGVSGTVTLAAGVYGHDRFKAGASGCTYTFSTTDNITTLTITAGTLKQVIEGANIYSCSYVLSWSGTAQGRINSGAYGSSGITATLAGGNDTTVEFSTGTLSLVQFERGTTPTQFEYRLMGQELALCQRYYEAGTASITVAPSTYFSTFSTDKPGQNVFFKVAKRTTPIMTTGGTVIIWRYRGDELVSFGASIDVNGFNVGLITDGTQVRGGQFLFSWKSEAEL